MNYLVIGGAGFVGSHLTEYLVSRGNKVTVLDNFSTGSRENLSGLPIELIEGDVRNIQHLKKAVRGVRVVFHLAALSSAEWSEEEMHAVNVQGTLNVLDACVEARVRRVVLSSSCAVYRDSKGEPYHEQMETIPVSPFGVSKLLSELYCQAYANLFDLETVILRYFNVFGPRQTSHTEDASAFPLLQEVLGKSAIQLSGDGTQKQDFTYIDNVVHANALAATCPKAAGRILNIAEGRSRSALDVAALLKEYTNTDIGVDHVEKANADPKPTRVSIDRAKEYLGYVPAVLFEEGLARTVAWYRQLQGRKVTPIDIPTLTDVMETAPAAGSEFPRVRECGPSQARRLPLQVQRWLAECMETVRKQAAGGQQDAAAAGTPGETQAGGTERRMVAVQ